MEILIFNDYTQQFYAIYKNIEIKIGIPKEYLQNARNSQQALTLAFGWQNTSLLSDLQVQLKGIKAQRLREEYAQKRLKKHKT